MVESPETTVWGTGSGGGTMRLLFLYAVVGLLGDADLAGGVADGFALGDEDLGFAQVVDDLLGGVPLPGHGNPFRPTRSLTLDLDPF